MNRNKLIAIIIGLVLISGMFAFGKIFMINGIEVVFVNQPMYVDEEEIIEASNLELGTNIFNLSETQMIKNIDAFYPDNTVEVVDIERTFPNKVKIKVKERIPIFLISKENSDEVIPTDSGFQMVRACNESDIDYEIIKVYGVAVKNTFNATRFHEIRSIANGFFAIKYNDASLTSFLKSIEYTEEGTYILTLRNGDGKIVLTQAQDGNMEDKVRQAMTAYCELGYSERAGKEITV